MATVMPWLASIIVAVISGIFSYLGVSRTAKSSFDISMVKIQEQINGIKEDVDRLEKKQDKHNAVIERTFKLEQKVDDLEKRI
jgi:hypothetical protein